LKKRQKNSLERKNKVYCQYICSDLPAADEKSILKTLGKDEKTLTNKTETDINDRYSNMTETPLGSKRD
jgi:hypothetical protein